MFGGGGGGCTGFPFIPSFKLNENIPSIQDSILEVSLLSTNQRNVARKSYPTSSAGTLHLTQENHVSS